MDSIHSLLRRQLKRHLGDLTDVPPQWQAFVNGVNEAYRAFDSDRTMLERSLELSSQELVDANAQMRAVFQAIPDLVLRLDPQGNVVDAKAGATGDLRVERNLFLGLALDDTPLQSIAGVLTAGVDQVHAYHAPVNVEYQIRHPEGDVHFEARLVPLEAEHTLVIIRDITERKRNDERMQRDVRTLQRAAEAAQAITQHQSLAPLLQEVAEQTRSVLRAQQCFVTLHHPGDASRTITGVSLSENYADWLDLIGKHGAAPTAADMDLSDVDLPVRLTEAELLGHPQWSAPLTRSDQRPRARGWLVAALKRRDGSTAGYIELSDKHHGDFSMSDQYVLEELSHIASTAIDNVGLIEEVRRFNAELEHRVAERTEALAHQEALFQAAADQAPQVMWIVNPKGAVTYLNRAWYDLVGGAPPKWYGHEWGDVVLPDDLAEMRRRWADVRRSGGVFAGTRRVRTKDGSVHTLSYRAAPVRGPKGEVTCWIGMDADITEIKAIEAALRRSNGELEAFSYSVSHDLRSPLRTIDGFSQLLARELPAIGSEKARAHLERIRGGVLQMSQLIESLLSLARISHSTLRPEPVNISELAQNIVTQLQARSPERHVSVDVTPDLVVEGDAGFLTIALENLLANAWKFSARREDAAIRVGSVALAGATSADPIYFVADNGAGFDMAYADKLFGTFQRLHSAAEFPGTGVGLATVKRVIDRHEGRVWAESHPGEGATFYFTLPHDGGNAPLPNSRPAPLA